MKILITDDNEADRKALQDTLIEEGHAIVTAADGVAALRIMEREQVDAIISDILMPRMDGYRLCHEVRRNRQFCDIPFIVYTGTYFSCKDEKVALIMGADAFVRKPAPKKVILDTVRKAATAMRLFPPAEVQAPKELEVLKEYSEQLIAKLEANNQDLVRVTEELRGSEERYRTLAETATDSIFVVNPSGAVEYINGHGARQFGRSQQELIGKLQTDLFPAGIAEATLHVIQKVFSAGKPLHEEAKRPYQNQELWQSTWLVPIKSAAGKVVSVMGVARDITQGKLLEEQLRHSQKMEAIGHLAGGVAHDFNNILTVIKGYTNFLLSRGDLDTEAMEQMHEVFIAADRASKLTAQLLTFSRKRTLKQQPVDLNQVLMQLTRMLRRVIGEDIRLLFSYSPQLPLIQADAAMMEQILMNLAVNARDALPKGGELFISTETQAIDETYVKRHPEATPGDFVCLTVRDTGCGIPPAIMPHVFEPFFTTKKPNQGTGLGLATVYGIVKQHQGWIEVSSQVGAGTTFRVFLPGRPDLIAMPARDAVLPEVSGGDETILMVEDEAELREVAKEILQGYGYRVLEAATGVEALSVWKQARGQVDLLLTDLIMPDGLTGLELATKLQERKPDLKVIYTTGYSLDLVEQKLALPPGVNMLQKPFSPPMLGQAVRACLDHQDSQQEALIWSEPLQPAMA